MKNLASKSSPGFTLIELLIVVTMLGILYVAADPVFSNFRSVETTATVENVNVLAQQWTYIHRELGVSPHPTSSNVIKSGYNVLDLIGYAGINTFALATGYSNKWSNLRVSPLVHTGLIDVTSAPTATTAGVYELNGYRMSFIAPSGTYRFEIAMYGVPWYLTEEIFEKFSNNSFTGTSQTVDGFRYSQVGSNFTLAFGFH